jgi:hypothetical protein
MQTVVEVGGVLGIARVGAECEFQGGAFCNGYEILIRQEEVGQI